jgi:hypothetical protein
MGRKRKDAEHEASVARLKAAIREPEFVNELNSLLEAEKTRGDSIFDSKYSDWDEARGWVIHYGLYYHLRDVCEKHGLFWQKDVIYVGRLLAALRDDQNLPSALSYALAPDDCPPRLHWQWFRMAQTGLAMPRSYERRTNERRSAKGLTLAEIAEHHAGNEDGVDEQTVLRAIRQCWKYLEHSSVNVRRVADLAGLTENEGLWFFFSVSILIENRNAERGRRSRKQEPDT